VKVGRGRVKVESRWITWEERGKEEEGGENKEREREENRNFA